MIKKCIIIQSIIINSEKYVLLPHDFMILIVISKYFRYFYLKLMNKGKTFVLTP